MHLDDRTAEPQSHAHALRLGGFEQVEHIFRTLRCDAWAIVFHLQVQLITHNLAPYAQLRFVTAGLGQRIDGVVEQVQNDLLQLRGIAMHAQVGITIDRTANVGMFHFRLDQVQHLLHHLVQFQGRVLAFAHAKQIAQFADDVCRTLRVMNDGVGHLGKKRQIGR